MLGAALVLVGLPTSVSAAPVTLYSESFSSAPAGWGTGGIAWTTSGGKFRADAGAFSGLPSLNYSLASRALSTAGYSNVEIRFDYSTTGLAGEYLFVNYANTGGGYSTILNQPADTAETSTGWISLTGATNHSGFVLQLSLVGNGVSSPAAVTIDNLEIRGEIIDTTDPTVTIVAPADGSIIPAATTTDFDVTVGDNVSAPDDVSVSYYFESVSNPAENFTTPAYPDAGGAASYGVVGSALATVLDLVAGDQFVWEVTVTDEANNAQTVTGGTYYYVNIPVVAPLITSGDPADGTEDVVYAGHTFTATGSGTVVFSHSGGTLPPGLTLTGATLAGTPTLAGSYDFDITASNGTAPDDVESYTIEIATVAPVITSGAPADGTEDVAYAGHTFTASGTDPVVFTHTGGTLPPGVTLTGATLSGTPTLAGSYDFDITASNGTAPDDVESYTIEVAAVAPLITSGAPGDGIEQVGYVGHTFTATGTDPVVFTHSGGTLPPGLTLSGATLSGTPTLAGSYDFDITASNGTAPDDVESYTIEIATVAPVITSGDPADGTEDVAYAGHTFAATGSGTVAFTHSGGTLPPGLTLTGATLSGTPTLAGSYDFDITASNGVAPDDVESYTIEIAAVAPVITSGAPGDGIEQVGYVGHTFTATGTDPVVFTHSGGTLPPGLTLLGASLLGTPTTAGSFDFDITASNGTAPDDVESYTIEIAPASSISGTPGPATVGVGYSFVPTLGGTAPFTVTLTSGSLPIGLNLTAATGEIAGTPADTAGTYSFELTVSGMTGPDDVLVAEIDLATGDAVNIFEVQSGSQSALAGGTIDADQGDSLTFQLWGADLGGNVIDITDDVVFESDVPTDVVTGATIAFPTASPHTITATYAPTDQTFVFVVEVTAAAAATADTGFELGWVLVLALAMLISGALVLGVRQVRGVRM